MARPRKEPTESIRIRTDSKQTLKTISEHFNVPVVDLIEKIIAGFAGMEELEKALWLGIAESKLPPKEMHGLIIGDYLQKKFNQ